MSSSLLGLTFSRLTVVSEAGQSKSREFLWNCICTCGAPVIVSSSSLNKGNTRSCGCLARELATAQCVSRTTHGKCFTRTYSIWGSMIKRCTNVKCKAFPDYGGRGVTVCDRWLKFENFLADMGEAPEGLTLERENNDQGYSLGNCNWATRKAQGRNKRNNRKVILNGKSMCLSEAAEALGVKYNTLHQRLRTGVSTPGLVA